MSTAHALPTSSRHPYRSGCLAPYRRLRWSTCEDIPSHHIGITTRVAPGRRSPWQGRAACGGRDYWSFGARRLRKRRRCGRDGSRGRGHNPRCTFDRDDSTTTQRSAGHDGTGDHVAGNVGDAGDDRAGQVKRRRALRRGSSRSSPTRSHRGRSRGIFPASMPRPLRQWRRCAFPVAWTCSWRSARTSMGARPRPTHRSSPDTHREPGADCRLPIGR